MPRNTDPGNLTVGTGLAGKDSVEANALVHPTGGNDGLVAHIVDPSRAHMAASVGLLDTAGNFVSDEVEGALAEVAGGITLGRTSGLLAGGTWTRVGNVLTLDAGTSVLVGSSVLDMSGESIALPDGVWWVYVDSTGTLVFNAAAPALANEPVLIGRIATVAGTIDTAASRDARFFVTGLDRKPPLTVRTTGAATDANSEGNFATLQAALLYLETYTGSDQIETRVLTVRGPITISSPITVPVDGLIFQGEGDGEFITGATVSPMIDLNGRSRIQFRDLLFSCDHVNSIAVGHAAVKVDRLIMERCRFLSAGQDWLRAISLTHAGSAILRDLQVVASDIGILVDRPSTLTIQNCSITDAGSGSVGIQVNPSGPFANEGEVHISDSFVFGFMLGLDCIAERATISGCELADCGDAMSLEGGSFKVSDCNVILSDTTGVDGISTLGPTQIDNCEIVCPRIVWGGESPVGVSFQGGSSESSVSNTRISGFANAASGSGVSISSQVNNVSVVGNTIIDCATGVSVNDGVEHAVISGNQISSNSIGVSVTGQDGAGTRTRNISITGNVVVFPTTQGIRLHGYIYGAVIDGNLVDGYKAADPYNPVCVGIQVSSNVTHHPTNVAVSNNEVWRCFAGILVLGTATGKAAYITIQGNRVHHCGYAQDLTGAAPDDFLGRGSKGIGAEYCEHLFVLGNTLNKIGLVIDNTGVEGSPNLAAPMNDVQARAIYTRNCGYVTIDGNQIDETSFTAGSTARAYGIYTEHHSTGAGANSIFEGLSISNNRVSWNTADGGEHGIVVEVSQGSDVGFSNTVSHGQINGNVIYRTTGDGIRVEAKSNGFFDNISISGNDIRLVCQGPDPVTGTMGAIHLYGVGGGADTVGFDIFKINDNHIEDVGRTAATGGHGIVTFLDIEGDVTAFVVSGNEVSNTQEDGVLFYSGNWAVPLSLTNIAVFGNGLDTCDNGIRFSAAGTVSGPDSWTNLNLSNNRISDVSTGISVSNAGPLTSTEVTGNVIDGAANAGVTLISTGASSDSSAVNVSSNDISNVTGGFGIYINAANDLRTCTVSSNSCHTFGNGVSGAGIEVRANTDAQAITILGNTLFSATANATGINGFFGKVLDTLIVSNNVVRMGGAGSNSMLFDAAVGASQFGVSIIGNALYGAALGVNRGSANWTPDRSVVIGNLERTAGPAAGNWAAFVVFFGVNSTVSLNQD